MVDEGRNTSRVLVVLAAGLIGIWYFQMTLWHTDLWGHLTYGRLLVEQGAIPETEPFIPSAADTPLVATAWLSQVVAYRVYDWFDAVGLKVAFALSIAVSWLLLTLACRRRCGSVTWAMICGGVFLGVASQQLRIIRPQLAGLTLFCLVLFEITRDRLSRRSIAFVAVGFCVWSNAHPSFPVGLGLVAVILFDRIRHSTITLKQSAWIATAAVVGTCLNPYGVWIYKLVLGFAASPNLESIVEWQPLSLSSIQGQWVIGVAVAILIALTISKQKPATGITLLLACLTVMLFRHSRFVVWWAVIAAYVLSACDIALPKLMSLDAVFGRLRIGRNALVAAIVGSGVAWISYDGSERAEKPESVSRFLCSRTPFDATNALVDADLPEGCRIFSTYEFSDYVLWNTWPHHRVLLTSHVHLLPPDDWQRYLNIVNLTGDWRNQFNQFDVNVVVVDITRHAQLADALQATNKWNLLHIDDVAIVLVRKPQ